MSALSEVDLRDFERLDVDTVKRAVYDLEDVSYPGSLYEASLRNIDLFIEQVENIKRKYVQQTPALFKPKA